MNTSKIFQYQNTSTYSLAIWSDPLVDRKPKYDFQSCYFATSWRSTLFSLRNRGSSKHTSCSTGNSQALKKKKKPPKTSLMNYEYNGILLYGVWNKYSVDGDTLHFQLGFVDFFNCWLGEKQQRMYSVKFILTGCYFIALSCDSCYLSLNVFAS